ncbi:beta-glucosidase [Vibrio xiamenensis]|uniref:Beta-glucosidase n=1 Tax=Vibrio xiamenensis TaxID=861298 RepID=A0A1G8CPJ2_9VIBR|nr:glycoside hydrolase family 3 C-terminal domain-containing protein [Vibrio xiamenensis]SDH47368.1 beta-glucosidase [Vibrio xiamenensis]
MNKRRFKFNPIMLALAVAVLAVGCNDDDNDDNDNQDTTTTETSYRTLAEQMVAKMSTSDKISVVSGPGYSSSDSVINLTNDVSGVAGYINGVSNDSLQIPATKLSDGPAGLRIDETRDGDDGTYYATAWPIGSTLASSWDKDLVEQVGAGQGNEALEYGVDIILAPGMNIQRNPLNGRNFEYYSEDPLLSGRMAGAMVTGMQSEGVGATIKHFFGNVSETNRYYVDDIGEPRTFREIYLRGFQIAADEAEPMAIMTSYNLVNGTYVNQRYDALRSILRDEWGFDGLVMSDWYAGNIYQMNEAVEIDEDSALKQQNAGNNLIEPGDASDALQTAYDAGELTDDVLDENVVDILTQVQQTPSYKGYSYSDDPDLDTHAELARQAAAESTILLKNSDSALPITAGKKVAAFGVNQINTYKGGTGSGDVNAAYTVNIIDGLEDQFEVDSALASYYATYFEENQVEETVFYNTVITCEEAAVTDNEELSTLLESAATDDDAAIISFGRQSGEAADRDSGRGDYLLSENELDMLTQVAEAFHAQDKKVVVVLNVAGIIDTSEWEDLVDAIVLPYMGGQEAGNAIADVLSGEVNPSGKLAQTIPNSYDDVPSAETFEGIDNNDDGVIDETDLNEGIYVGYRYYTSFDVDVAYPFGYGLSYTTFDYGQPTITANTLSSGADGSISFSATITNSGSVAGKEAAELYISAPEVKLKKPTIELKDFAKTSELAAGASETLSFNVPASILASFDQDNNQWIIEPGSYKVYVAPSSDVEDVTPITFSVSSEIVVSNTTEGALALPDGVDASSFVTVSE